MSNSVTPLPTGTGVTVIAEHRPRRDPERHHEADEQPVADDNTDDDSRQSRHHSGGPLPVVDEETVPAETLFAATLMASEQQYRPPSPDELRLRTGPHWAPPDSALRLKDRLA